MKDATSPRTSATLRFRSGTGGEIEITTSAQQGFYRFAVKQDD